MGVKYIGAEVQRMEDSRLLKGSGRYVDDITRDRMLHVAFLRSEHAHANIKNIDTEIAKNLDGVHGVLTYRDIASSFDLKRMGQLFPAPVIEQNITQYPVANEEVCYVGEIVAVVVAENRAVAEDAIEIINVEYDVLPAIIDCRLALEPNAPKAHNKSKNNLVGVIQTSFGEIDEAFKTADHIFRRSFLQHRGGCHAMECLSLIHI